MTVHVICMRARMVYYWPWLARLTRPLRSGVRASFCSRVRLRSRVRAYFPSQVRLHSRVRAYFPSQVRAYFPSQVHLRSQARAYFPSQVHLRSRDRVSFGSQVRLARLTRSLHSQVWVYFRSRVRLRSCVWVYFRSRVRIVPLGHHKRWLLAEKLLTVAKELDIAHCTRAGSCRQEFPRRLQDLMPRGCTPQRANCRRLRKHLPLETCKSYVLS